MKNRIAGLLNSLIFSSLLLLSCSNPISNRDMDSEENSRNAKNAELFSITLQSKDESGTTEPDGEFYVKLNELYSISFTEKDEFQFSRWEAVDKTSGKMLADTVYFEDRYKSETKIKILKKEKNILIRAVCVPRPLCISKKPEFRDDGVYSDSVIVITFDKEISEDSFYYTDKELSQINYDLLLTGSNGKVYGYIDDENYFFKNIAISSSKDENLLPYFSEPVLQNGTILKLYPKNQVSIIRNGEQFVDVDVFVSPQVMDNEKIMIGGEGVQWRYRINPNTDKIEPVILSLNFTQAKDLIYFNGSVLEQDSGINYVNVLSKRIKTPEGVAVNDEPVEKIINNPIVTKKESDDVDISGMFSLENEDGLIEVTVSVFDYSGNESAEKQKWLIEKDTTVDVSGINIFNYNLSDYASMEDLNLAARTICWTNSNLRETVSYKLFWGTNKDNLTENAVISKNENYSNGVWSFVLPQLNSSVNTYVRLEVMDKLGNAGYVENVIPAVPSYFVYQKLNKSDSNYRIFYSNPKGISSGNLKGNLYYVYGNSVPVKTVSVNDKDSSDCGYFDICVDDISKCEFYFQLASYSSSNLLVSAIKQFNIKEAENCILPEINSIIVERGKENSGKNSVTVNYSKNESSNVQYGLFWGKSEDSIVHYEKSSSFEIDSGISTLYYKTVYIDSKNGTTKTSEIFTYDLSNQNYDTLPPSVSNYQIIGSYSKTAEYTSSEYYPIITCEINFDNYPLANGQAEYKLYSVPVYSSDTRFEDLSEQDIKESACIVKKFVPPSNPKASVMVWNYVEGLGSAESYYYVLYLQDADGNYSYTPVKCSKQLLQKTPAIAISENKENPDLVNIDVSIQKEKDAKDYQVEYSIFDTKNNPLVYRAFSNKRLDEEEDDILSVRITDKKDSFYFGYVKAEYKNRNQTAYKFTYPLYFYTGVDSRAECQLKEVVDGMEGTQIYCDRPCLVMTYWSSENYGYSIPAWETYGVQQNPVYVSAIDEATGDFKDTFVYYGINKDEIPMGKYYVVITHFADGTAVMSKTIKTN